MKILSTLRAALLGSMFAPTARFVGICRTRDSYTAFGYRMGAGFPGDVNRTHPASIEPTLNDPDDPITFYGEACVVEPTNNSVRKVAAGDGAITSLYGVSVRPYPIQQQSGGMSASFGSAAAPTDQPLDVLKSGYIMVLVNGTVRKGDPVHVWIAASAGNHVQGGFEAAADGGNTVLLANPNKNYFNGPADANGVTEIAFNV